MAKNQSEFSSNCHFFSACVTQHIVQTGLFGNEFKKNSRKQRKPLKRSILIHKHRKYRWLKIHIFHFKRDNWTGASIHAYDCFSIFVDLSVDDFFFVHIASMSNTTSSFHTLQFDGSHFLIRILSIYRHFNFRKLFKTIRSIRASVSVHSIFFYYAISWFGLLPEAIAWKKGYQDKLEVCLSFAYSFFSKCWTFSFWIVFA